MTQSVTVASESAVPVHTLPQEWQDIWEKRDTPATDRPWGMTEPSAYVQMAQLFLYKMRNGDVDLFNKREDLLPYREVFCKLFGQLVQETLVFYAGDFQKNQYPNLTAIHEQLKIEGDEDRSNIACAARHLFERFGYDFPASFYWCLISPIEREAVCEIVPLRFSERDKGNARAWDATLHAQKVFPIQLEIQATLSQHGYFALHGCGCNHGLQRLGRANSSFVYEMKPEMFRTWVRDFIWTMWYEYAFFPFTPVTRFLTGEIIAFD